MRNVTQYLGALASLAALAGCGGSAQPGPAPTPSPACQPGHSVVDSQSGCLQDDAVCYQLASGEWCTGSDGASPPPSPPPASGGACVSAGCSGTQCVASAHPLATGGMATTCEFKPEYACYRDAACEQQSDGHCGWTKTPALDACLANPPAE